MEGEVDETTGPDESPPYSPGLAVSQMERTGDGGIHVLIYTKRKVRNGRTDRGRNDVSG